MGVPKKRMSAQKRDQRRSQNYKFTPVAVTMCPKCNEPKAPHQVCPACGQYNGRQVMAAKA